MLIAQMKMAAIQSFARSLRYEDILHIYSLKTIDVIDSQVLEQKSALLDLL